MCYTVRLDHFSFYVNDKVAQAVEIIVAYVFGAILMCFYPQLGELIKMIH